MYAINRYIPAYITALVFVLIFFTPGCKKATLEWGETEQLAGNTTDRLNRILFIDDKTGFVVGGQRFYKSTILVTRDGGSTWQPYDFPEAGKGIYGITSHPERGIYACGYDSKMLFTTDTAKSWNFRQINNWKPCKDLALVDPNTIIIISGISFNVGGITYLNHDNQIYRDDSLGYELNDIEMLNNHVGYISGYGVVMKTTDGAIKWNILDIQNDNFTGMHILNEQELWVCGYNGSIFHTSDGGNSWEKLRNGNNSTKERYHLLDIVFKDAQNGWAVGEEGIVIHTQDGGHSWEEYKKFTKNALRSIVIAPDGRLIVCGDGGTLYRLRAQ